ncbi:SDR family NAD(P)-dependent oxidoreductase [Pantoea cypripedii]|uniref:SDR family NAD(P)-dependent oxidoreductase n=1 Tax=Pantoea cypripedii TaxID=55209 RepID=UPI000A1045FD|nr:SDR family oxidoreductase [Pantoea cypripedii]MBP2199105.1 NAD(P)-dependent dehydrogenase (short-subunit alcohol dehydrogenase family) [Pantoea cypripedii]
MGTNVIVTGHASGIGWYIAKKFHDEGFNVTGIDKDRASGLDKSINQIQCDLSNWEAVKDAFSHLDRIDYAVNAAGVPGVRKSFDNITSEEMIESYKSIFLPTFHACKAEINCMVRNDRHSKIINIASSTASFGSKDMVAYSSAKAAIVNLTKVCAVEYAPKIQINSISPATVDTPMIRRKYNDELPDYSEAYLTGNCGTVHDIWTAVKFFIENNFMTGSDLLMDGGYSSSFSPRLKQKEAP